MHALGTAGLLCAAMLILVAALVTEDRLAGPWLGTFVADPYDDYGFATGKALGLWRHPVAGPQLAVIGAGATRESLTGEADIAERLAAGLGRHIPVHDFTTGSQSAIEMAAFAESLGPAFDGVLVLAISPNRLSADRAEMAGLVAQPRLGFVSAAADDEIRATGYAVPPRTGIYLIDNRQFFVARHRAILRHLLEGPVPAPAGRTYLGRPPADARQWAADAALLRERLQRYEARADQNLESIARLLARLPNRDRIQVVLLEIPLNPRLLGEVIAPEFLDGHRRRVARFAQEHGARYWDLGAAAELAPDDFQDWSHLRRAEAQQRYTAALVANLLPLFSPPTTARLTTAGH